MLSKQTCFWHFLLALWLGSSVSTLSAQSGRGRSMPTASLPIEPASADPEGSEERNPDLAPLELKEMRPLRNRPARSSTASPDVSAQASILMTRDGVGGQLQFLEFAEPWMAISQTLRYQAPADPDALFERQYGLMLGLDLHPWRQARFSPVLNLQAGGDRFRRGWEQEDLDLFGFEASAGIEMKLARAVSFLFRWTEVFYPGLEEPLFVDQKLGQKYAGSFQVFFNLRWESAM